MIPIAYSALLAIPDGVGSAEACSGGAPGVQVGISSLGFPAQEVVPVGRDGLFTLRIIADGVSDDEAVERVAIEVRDAEGEAVAGRKTKLSSTGSDGFAARRRARRA